MQDPELESLLMGAEHSPKVKAAPIKSDSGSGDCVELASSTAESRLNLIQPTFYRQIINTKSLLQKEPKWYQIPQLLQAK